MLTFHGLPFADCDDICQVEDCLLPVCISGPAGKMAPFKKVSERDFSDRGKKRQGLRQ